MLATEYRENFRKVISQCSIIIDTVVSATIDMSSGKIYGVSVISIDEI